MSNNLNQKLKKVIVAFLVITLTYVNFALIGSNIVNGLISYALNEENNFAVAQQRLVTNKVYEINGEQKRIIQVEINSGIDSNEDLIKETTLTLDKNIIEGTLEDVKVAGLIKNSYTKGSWTVEDEKIKISLINENETLESQESILDSMLVTYVFSNSDEIETIKQPLEKVEVKTYTNETLSEEYEESIFEEINVEGDILQLNIENNDIHKNTMDEENEFTEELSIDLGYRKDVSKITVEDTANDFYNNENQKDEDIAKLKYIKTTLSKADLISILGEEGTLTISNPITQDVFGKITKQYIEEKEADAEDQDNIKITVTKYDDDEIIGYITITEESIILEYVEETANLKLQLENILEQSESEIMLSQFVMQNVKSISNISNLDDLNYLKENVKYVVNEEEKEVESTITFKDTITRARLDIDNTEWTAGDVNNVNYKITLDTTSEKSELFVNPMFIIQLPSSVESINTENSIFTILNNNGAFTGKRVFVVTIAEVKYVVITLTGEQTQESIQSGDTAIDIALELNVKENVQGNETTKLYYQNSTVTAYENGNGFDTDEIDITLIMESEPEEEIPEENLDISLDISNNVNEEDVIKPGDEYTYTVYVYNFDEEARHDLLLSNILPEGVTLKKVVELIEKENFSTEEKDVVYNYNEGTREISIDIDEINGYVEETIQNEETEETETIGRLGSRVFAITVQANKLPDGVYSKEVENIARVKYKNLTIVEVKNTEKISDAFLEITTEKLQEKINEQEEVILELKITNKGLVSAKGVNINVNLPEEFIPSRYIASILSESGEEEGRTESTLSGNLELTSVEIQGQKTYYLKIIGTLEDVDDTTELVVKGTVNDKEISWGTEIVDIPEDPEDPEDPNNPEDPDNPSNPEDPDNPSNPENPDNPSNPGDPDNPSNPEDPDNPSNPGDPDNPGNPGDPDNPSNPGDPDNPSNPGNSDDPENGTQGFDLSLKQYLNKVTVTNSQGTTTYNYTDTDFAKVEIYRKYMDGSNVTLEYKVVIKNNGTIPGYARKIVDYLPNDLKFNPDLNKDWYLGEDGNAYSTVLIDRLLNPGDTAELTIILEKQMTNENTGTTKNTIEIYEASNENNLEDINSIPADKIEGQNDMSTVEIIIAVRTGTIVLYISLAILVISILGIGLYKVRKITLNKKGGC